METFQEYNTQNNLPKREVEAFISLGSNMGDREQNLKRAVEALYQQPHIRVLRLSPIYETSPVGYTDQCDFLNMVAAISTSLAPIPLLDVMMHVERRLGRIRTVRWGPRTIDLDLLLYDRFKIRTRQLTIPHPRMFERLFVLVPLADVLGESAVLETKTISRMIETLDGKEEIKPWKKINWLCEFGGFEN